MDRVEEAFLAFVGTGETTKNYLLSDDFLNNKHIRNLIRDGFIEINNKKLLCTIKGWHYLDTRPIEHV